MATKQRRRTTREIDSKARRILDSWENAERAAGRDPARAGSYADMEAADLAAPPAAIRLVAPSRNRSPRPLTDTEVRAMAYAILDANPAMSRNDLRKKLRVRQERANSLHEAWQIARGMQGLPRTSEQKRAR